MWPFRAVICGTSIWRIFGQTQKAKPFGFCPKSHFSTSKWLLWTTALNGCFKSLLAMPHLNNCSNSIMTTALNSCSKRLQMTALNGCSKSLLQIIDFFCGKLSENERKGVEKSQTRTALLWGCPKIRPMLSNFHRKKNSWLLVGLYRYAMLLGLYLYALLLGLIDTPFFIPY